MKFFIGIFIIICLFSISFNSYHLNAQSFERCWQEASIHAQVNDIDYSSMDSTWIVAGPDSSCYVKKLSKEGNVLWTNMNIIPTLMEGNIKNITQILSLPNGDILASGLAFDCLATEPPVIFPFLIKLNTTGEVLWTKHGVGYDGNKDMVLIDDTHVVLLGHLESISMVNLDGDVMWSKELEVDFIKNSIVPFDTTSPLYSTAFMIGGNDFLVFLSKKDGSFLAEFPFSNLLSIVRQDNSQGYLFLLNFEEVGFYIIHFDINFEDDAEEILLMSSTLNKPEELHILPNNHFAVLGKHENSTSKIVVFDYGINIVNEISFDSRRMNIYDIASSESGELGISGSTATFSYYSEETDSWISLNQGSSSSAFIQVFDPLEKPLTHQIDVGVEDVIFSSFHTEIEDEVNAEGCWEGEPNPLRKKIVLENVQIQVKNYGNEVINNFSINFRRSLFCDNLLCSRAFAIFKEIENISLNPSETYNLNLGTITLHNQLVELNSIFDFELCFSASEPNQKIDINPKNNIHCKYLYFTDIEDKTPLSSFNISPNPSQDKFNIEVPSLQNERLQLQLMDMQGKILYQTHFSQKWELDLSTYSIGVYLLKVSDGFNSHTEKLFRN